MKRKNSSIKKSQLPFRLNFLFFIVFLLFAVLVAQLAYLQVLYGSKFESDVNQTNESIVSGNVPRGMIFDSKGRVLVGNNAKNAISYTKGVDTLSTQMYQVANRLSNYITVDTSKLSKQDKADYYLANASNLKRETNDLPKSQRVDANGNERPEKEIYNHLVSNVKKKNIQLSEQQLKSAAIFKQMNSAYQLSTIYIKNDDVSQKEVAAVGEHLTELPGINVTTDWQRSYPNGKSMTSIIGNVSTESQGLPKDDLKELLAKGYSRNDRVGTSYLEKQYESVLKGTKSQTQVSLGSKNQITKSKVVYKGQKGDNLNLTIDSDYQKQVEDALSSVYSQAKSAGATQYSNGAYAVAMNPKTGAVLAMAGLQNDPSTGATTDDALGVINRTFVMGSAVKGATVMGGLMDGVITPTNNIQNDAPIYLPGTPVKKSVYPAGTFGSMDAVTALEVSSNIYMMNLAMKEGNASYVPNSSFSIDHNIFQTERGYFNQFGLGVKTGIDLPGEVQPVAGTDYNSDGTFKSGSTLDLSYGNYDPYTLIDLGQYVSTIANGGYRMKPYVVKSIQGTNKDGSLGAVKSVTTPTVMNKIDATESEFNVVKKGFYATVHGTNGWGTAHALADATKSISGKTGTAQSFAHVDPNNDKSQQVETITLSFVGYAPSDDPQIAIAVVFPNLSNENQNYNLLLAKEMFNDYFKDEK